MAKLQQGGRPSKEDLALGDLSGGNECRPLGNEFTALLPSPPLLWLGPPAPKGAQLVADLLASF